MNHYNINNWASIHMLPILLISHNEFVCMLYIGLNWYAHSAVVHLMVMLNVENYEVVRLWCAWFEKKNQQKNVLEQASLWRQLSEKKDTRRNTLLRILKGAEEDLHRETMNVFISFLFSASSSIENDTASQHDTCWGKSVQLVIHFSMVVFIDVRVSFTRSQWVGSMHAVAMVVQRLQIPMKDFGIIKFYVRLMPFHNYFIGLRFAKCADE